MTHKVIFFFKITGCNNFHLTKKLGFACAFRKNRGEVHELSIKNERKKCWSEKTEKRHCGSSARFQSEIRLMDW